jgi:hypothetical protein
MLRLTAAFLLLHSAIAQVPTNPPNPGNPVCFICGTGKAITNPDGVVVFPGQPELSCAQVESAGLNGFIEVGQCPFVVTFLDECFCEATSPPSPTPAPVIVSPVTPQPTDPEPTSKPSISQFPSTKPVTRQPTPEPQTSKPTTRAPTPEPGTPKPSTAPTTRVPTIEPITSQPTTRAPVIPTSPSPTLNCGGPGKECQSDAECCSESCQLQPAKRLGLCLSIREAAKDALKLAEGQGGAGGGGL